MLHGDEALANELHLRLVHPLNDGVIADLEAAQSFLSTCVRKWTPNTNEKFTV